MAKNTQKRETSSAIRMDKWLWAARFFKTRSLAKAAIEGGKVHYQGERVKVSRDVHIGMELTIQQGLDKKTVIVQGLSDVRGPAPIAQQLYQETEESIARRNQLAEQRKMAHIMYPSARPNKKDRRELARWQHDYQHSDAHHIDDNYQHEHDVDTDEWDNHWHDDDIDEMVDDLHDDFVDDTCDDDENHQPAQYTVTITRRKR